MESFELQSRAESFLKMYRILENTLEKRYPDLKPGISVVMHFLGEPESAPFRAKLNTFREIRNLLTHNADDAGEPLIEPSQAVLQELYGIVRQVCAPKMAIDCGTPRESLFITRYNDPIRDVIACMNKRGFSSVPVLDNRRIVGVFDPESLFSYLNIMGLDAIHEKTRIGDLRNFLSTDTQGNPRYLFMPENTTLQAVRAAFETRIERNARLRAVLITKNGRSDEYLLAMLSHWDVLKEKYDYY